MSSNIPDYGFPIPPSPSKYMRAFLAWVDAFNAWDLDLIIDCFDDTLEHHLLPKSMGRPVFNKIQYKEYMKAIIPRLKSFKLTIEEVVEAGNQIAIHTRSAGEMASGSPYANEYMVIIHFVPAVESDEPNILPKIRLIKEYVDSAYSAKHIGAELKRQEEV